MLQDNVAGISGTLIHYPIAQTASRPDEARVDLKELARVLKRQRWPILLTTSIPVLITLAYVLLATPLYTAYTQILIDPRDKRIVSNEVSPEVLAADGGVAVVESQLLVITSDNVLRRVISREHLESDPEFGGVATDPFSVAFRRLLTGLGLDPEAAEGGDPQLKALRQLKRRIGVKRSEKAFVADVYVSTDSKAKSVRIADAIAQAYLDDQADARAAASQRASRELTARLEVLRNRVREAEDRVLEYKRQHQIISAGGILVNEQQLSEMNVRLNDARARVAEARSRFEQIQRAKKMGADSGAIPEAVQSQTIGQLRAQYAELIRHRADLRGRLGPRHPDLHTLDAQAKDLQALIEGELSRIGAAAQSELARTEASEREIKASLDRLKAEAISTNQASIQLRELERDAEASRAVYQTFLTRARETGEQKSIDSTNARVISRATPPRDRSWPPRGLLLVAALFAGLGIGTGVGLIRDYLDEMVRTPRQLEQLVSAPVLGVLPQLSERRRNRGGKSSQHISQALGDATEVETSNDGELAQFASLIRGVLNALCANDRPAVGRAILICSATTGEGKTTVALNLAVEAAREGGRILLVDADFNGPTLSRNPAAKTGAGLFDLLEGRVKLSSVLYTQEETGLQFLSLGKATRVETQRPPAEVIAQKLVEPARSFDLVIIDSGGVLTDARVLPFAEVVDDILFVVRAGKSKKDDILAAIASLRLSARKIRGTLLTSMSGSSA